MRRIKNKRKIVKKETFISLEKSPRQYAAEILAVTDRNTKIRLYHAVPTEFKERVKIYLKMALEKNVKR
jgi:16S rRNA U1498 N3-methylase RsmE